MHRRTFLSAAAALPAAAAATSASVPLSLSAVVERHDQNVERLLRVQNTDPRSRWRGGVPSEFGLHEPGTGAGVYHSLTTAYLQPLSRYHQKAELLERIKLAADFLNRSQTDDGNVDLLITNFNSPPDIAFVTLSLAPPVVLAREAGRHDIAGLLEEFLRKAGGAMVRGGVHTPNHRWIMCAALASLYELFPDDAYLRRAEEWLSETIDIDADGQYSERSTTVYNGHVDKALLLTAVKFNKSELLDPVRKNLNAMKYLLHPDGEVVTEISRRQDANTRGTLSYYWFPLRYLAVTDKNGQYETLARSLEPQYASLAALMEYPFLLEGRTQPEPLPSNYVKVFPANGVVRIRREDLSATFLLRGNSRLFSARKGEAVVEAVRMAGAFFGKGQFVPRTGRAEPGGWSSFQKLDAGYYQPFGDGRAQPWGVETWYEMRPERERTEVSEFQYRADLTEVEGGFNLRLRAWGTRDVPVAVEINLREGGKLKGCVPAPGAENAFLLEKGYGVYTVGGNSVRIGPGIAENRYTQIRGALPKLDGTSVYLTGYAPFDHTLELRFS